MREFQVSVGRSKGKGLIGRPRVKWDNCKVLKGDLKERDYLEGLGVNGRIILKLMYKKCFGQTLTRFIWLWTEKVYDECVFGNELSCSINYLDFLD